MPEVHINFAAVICAAIANMIIGTLWYGPLFGKPWKKILGFTDESMKAMNMTPLRAMIGGFISALLMSYVLAFAIVFSSTYMGTGAVASGLMSGFFNWLGFIVPITAGAVLWEGKPWKLFFINASNWLVTLLVMGLILASWR